MDPIICKQYCLHGNSGEKPGSSRVVIHYLEPGLLCKKHVEFHASQSDARFENLTTEITLFISMVFAKRYSHCFYSYYTPLIELELFSIYFESRMIHASLLCNFIVASFSKLKIYLAHADITRHFTFFAKCHFCSDKRVNYPSSKIGFLLLLQISSEKWIFLSSTQLEQI